MQLPKRVKIVEVGPRDGLQNEPDNLPPEVKIELIDRLSACGLCAIEVGSLVSPIKVPQMADSEDVYRKIDRRPNVDYCMLVGNKKGMERALSAGVESIAVFAAASETFSKHNNNCSITENLDEIKQLCQEARENKIKVRGYISCVLGCPYEGPVDVAQVTELARKLYELGCHEISLGDTIGVGTPGVTKQLIDSTARHIPLENIAVHFHDTYGQALANIFAALQQGVRTIDSSVAGLGGCPYAPGATGNVASEDVVYMLNGLGISSGIDLEKLVETGWYIADCLGRKPSSKASLAFQANANSEFSKSRSV